MDLYFGVVSPYKRRGQLLTECAITYLKCLNMFGHAAAATTDYCQLM